MIGTSFTNRKRYDFRLFKESQIRVKPETEIDTDTGYQGIARLHANSSLPNMRFGKMSNITGAITTRLRNGRGYACLMNSRYSRKAARLSDPRIK
jgi:hypothetical protein